MKHTAVPNLPSEYIGEYLTKQNQANTWTENMAMQLISWRPMQHWKAQVNVSLRTILAKTVIFKYLPTFANPKENETP